VVFCWGSLPLDCVGPRHRALIRTHSTAPIRHPGDTPLRRAAPAPGLAYEHFLIEFLNAFALLIRKKAVQKHRFGKTKCKWKSKSNLCNLGNSSLALVYTLFRKAVFFLGWYVFGEIFT
jgi:hypothetical protein